jgi:hypothetical protein
LIEAARIAQPALHPPPRRADVAAGARGEPRLEAGATTTPDTVKGSVGYPAEPVMLTRSPHRIERQPLKPLPVATHPRTSRSSCPGDVAIRVQEPRGARVATHRRCLAEMCGDRLKTLAVICEASCGERASQASHSIWKQPPASLPAVAR